MRTAVLASGRGSNLQALLDYLARYASAPPAHVVLVASDRADVGAQVLARDRGVPGVALGAGGGEAAALERLLRQHEVELVVLAGYVRFVPAAITRAWRGRIINVHPALLPAFGGPGMYGARVHRAVLAAGGRVTGATVHFVDEEYDRGAIIAQWPVPVLAMDREQTLAARVLRVEHLLLPRVVHAVATRRVWLDDDNRVRRAGNPPTGTASGPEVAFDLSALDDTSLAAALDAALTR